MREIKFRAWHGKLERMIDLKWSVFGECGFYWTDENGKQWECEWDTVMQYTGLKDKNGKEIYEGDIVQVSMIRGHYVCEVVDSKNIGSKSIGEVYYSACHYAVKFPEGYFDLIDLMSDQEKMNCKVIGNIHENPDLLK